MNFNHASPQYRRHIVLRGLGVCPVCGGKSSPRSPKGRYCEKHVEMRAAGQRRRIGAKNSFVTKVQWLQVDWTLGPDMVAALLGVVRSTVKKHYKILLALKKIKAVPGFIQEQFGRKKGRR